MKNLHSFFLPIKKKKKMSKSGGRAFFFYFFFSWSNIIKKKKKKKERKKKKKSFLFISFLFSFPSSFFHFHFSFFSFFHFFFEKDFFVSYIIFLYFNINVITKILKKKNPKKLTKFWKRISFLFFLTCRPSWTSRRWWRFW